MDALRRALTDLLAATAQTRNQSHRINWEWLETAEQAARAALAMSSGMPEPGMEASGAENPIRPDHQTKSIEEVK